MSNESQARQIVQKLKTISVALKSMAAKPHDAKLRKEADHLKTQANLLIRKMDVLYNADKELFKYLDAANAHHQRALLSEYDIRTKDGVYEKEIDALHAHLSAALTKMKRMLEMAKAVSSSKTYRDAYVACVKVQNEANKIYREFDRDANSIVAYNTAIKAEIRNMKIKLEKAKVSVIQAANESFNSFSR